MLTASPSVAWKVKLLLDGDRLDWTHLKLQENNNKEQE